jgi:hypothetical protein
MDSKFCSERVFVPFNLFPNYATINVLDNFSSMGSEQTLSSVRHEQKFYMLFSFVLPIKGSPNFINKSSFQNQYIRGTDHNCYIKANHFNVKSQAITKNHAPSTLQIRMMCAAIYFTLQIRQLAIAIKIVKPIDNKRGWSMKLIFLGTQRRHFMRI